MSSLSNQNNTRPNLPRTFYHTYAIRVFDMAAPLTQDA
jgi:hypothetical protein